MKISATHHRTKQGVVKRNPRYFKGNIEKLTEKNTYFRKVLYTGKQQLVVMSIPVGGEIGNEIHKVDQFFRIEEGKAQFILLGKKFTLGPGGGFIVKSGTYHNIKNVGKEPLKLYSLYAPANHPAGTIDKTRADAILREKE